MRIISYVLAAAAGALVVGIIALSQMAPLREGAALQKLHSARAAVENNLHEIRRRIASQCAAFGRAAASDREFGIALLGEGDRSSPAVTGFAPRYLGPMGFSLLQIFDSSGVILSSGHFSASAGNPVSPAERSLPTDDAVFIDANVKGQQTLALESRSAFTIEEIPFFCSGGIRFDENLIKSLIPDSGVSIIIKQGSTFTGTLPVSSVSPLSNKKMLVNGSSYMADSMALPWAGGENAPVLYVLVK
jgi:hypothetical protein